MKEEKVLFAEAHCDGPCGVYDPASARIAAEKLIALECPDPRDKAAFTAYLNSFSRYDAIKEEQAQIAKAELLILWTDYFKAPHLEKFPQLHDLFWKAAKLCSACKVEVSLSHAEELMDCIKEVHRIFWATKGREVAWYTAS